MKKTWDLFDSVVSFLGFSIGGGILGIIVGIVYATLQISGTFASWELLESTSRFVEIVDANSQHVWAKSIEGDLYEWNCQSKKECNWVEVKKVPDYAHETYGDLHGELSFEKDKLCPKNNLVSVSNDPPREMVECAFGWYSGIDGGSGGYFALLEDGTIWSWHHASDQIGLIMAIPYFARYGFYISTLAFIFFLINKVNKNRNQATDRN